MGDGELVLPLPAANGVLGFLSAACAEAPDEDKVALLAACGAMIAVSLQRALEQDELERLGRLKSNFIALASHELRGPATIVHGIAKTIDARADSLDPQQIDDLQHVLVVQTGRLTRLIDELLDLSRLEAKVVEIQPQRVEVRRCVEEIVDSVAPGAARRDRDHGRARARDERRPARARADRLESRARTRSATAGRRSACARSRPTGTSA